MCRACWQRRGVSGEFLRRHLRVGRLANSGLGVGHAAVVQEFVDELVDGRGGTDVSILALAVGVARSLESPSQTQLLAVDFRLLHSSASPCMAVMFVAPGSV
jgi:hypothetical protein